jgi:hypothetical protein
MIPNTPGNLAGGVERPRRGTHRRRPGPLRLARRLRARHQRGQARPRPFPGFERGAALAWDSPGRLQPTLLRLAYVRAGYEETHAAPDAEVRWGQTAW